MSVAQLPTAEVADRPTRPWTRLLPLLAALLALALLRQSWSARGPRIVVRASQGHGLAPGDSLRTRGIEIGRVESVALDAEGAGIEIEVRLARSARAALRAGSRYWVARPVLGVEGVSGLETALGARYLAVLPGPEGAAEQRAFVALPEPPLEAAEEPDALEVVLLAPSRGGLARGAPVLYRGLAVGSVVSVALADDASAVELRARVRAPFAELVRTDSRFARAPAAAFSVGLGGLELELGSLQSLWLGGVELATPTHPGPRARTGQRYELAEGVDAEWSSWRPALPVGVAWLPEGAAPPTRSFAQLRFRAEGWFARASARSGWLTRDGGDWLGPADVLVAPPGASEARLELGGESHVVLGVEPAWSDGRVAARTLAPASGPGRVERRALGVPEDLLLCADPALAPIAVSARHLLPSEGEFRVAREVALDERWHGAAALARADGAWVGLLLVGSDGARVVPVRR